MNIPLIRGTKGTALIHIKAPSKHEMGACTREIQIWIASYVQMPEKTLMMYDLAFANSQWCTLRDDMAFIPVPPRYNTRWIGIIPLWIYPRPFELLDCLDGEAISKSALREISGRQMRIRIRVLVMRKCAKPHIIVNGDYAKDAHKCIVMIRDRLAWAEGEIARDKDQVRRR